MDFNGNKLTLSHVQTNWGASAKITLRNILTQVEIVQIEQFLTLPPLFQDYSIIVLSLIAIVYMFAWVFSKSSVVKMCCMLVSVNEYIITIDTLLYSIFGNDELFLNIVFYCT